MAVPAYLRQDNSARFITVAHEITAWCYKWCKDERMFGRRERWMSAGPLWEQALRLLLDVRQGNRRGLKDDADYAARREYLTDALDAIEAISTIITMKYDHIQQGFNATGQAAPETEAKQPTSDDLPSKKRSHRGGKSKLTLDDIDRAFCVVCDLLDEEDKLLHGLILSDARRHTEATETAGTALPATGESPE